MKLVVELLPVLPAQWKVGSAAGDCQATTGINKGGRWTTPGDGKRGWLAKGEWRRVELAVGHVRRASAGEATEEKVRAGGQG